MTVRPKNAEAIVKMQAAGQVVAEVLELLRTLCRPGITTAELDAAAVQRMKDRGGRSLFRGQPHPRGGVAYPGNICVSVNEELVHGIPGPRRIAEGDVVSVDVGVEKDGWCGDAARTFVVGQASPAVDALVKATAEALNVVRREARAGVLWSAVAGRIQTLVESRGFSVVREYVGHGIGRQMWEPPRVPNYVGGDMARDDFLLAEGVTLAVEPMVNMGRRQVRELDDGWTVVAADGKPCAHFEDTFVIRPNGAEPLTRLYAGGVEVIQDRG
ncbi:MAG: type I methionyl aminopeptidase [Planctomycetota bacterium]|nr:type I methionyl aminopeptidase [Planctomycetota bacterium]